LLPLSALERMPGQLQIDSEPPVDNFNIFLQVTNINLAVSICTQELDLSFRSGMKVVDRLLNYVYWIVVVLFVLSKFVY